MYIQEYRFMLEKTLAPARRHTPTPSTWHYSRCRLDCQHPRMTPCLFQGIPHLHDIQILYIISKRRETMTAQKPLPTENGKHAACTHHQPSQLHGQLDSRLSQPASSWICTASCVRTLSTNTAPSSHVPPLGEENSWHSSTEGCSNYKSKMERNTQTIMYVTWDTII